VPRARYPEANGPLRTRFLLPAPPSRLIALPFGRLWYDTPDNAIGYAVHSSRSHNAVIRVYDAAGNVIETHQHKGEFREW